MLSGWGFWLVFLFSLDLRKCFLHYFIEMGIPSSVDLVSSDPSLMVASFNSGHTSVFNMETRQRILTLESSVDTCMYKEKKKPKQKNLFV